MMIFLPFPDFRNHRLGSHTAYHTDTPISGNNISKAFNCYSTLKNHHNIPYDEIYYESEAKEFLHSFPLIGSKSLTCVLKNDERYFLRQRNSTSSSLNSISMKEYLLSKPMKALLQEAENIQIQKLTMPNTTTTNNNNSKLYISNNYSISNQSLWVDKYAPKSFAEV